MSLTVACVKWGSLYSDDCVTKLRDGVARHLPKPHRFVCFADAPVDGVECRPLPDEMPRWWGKMHLFRPDVFEDGERVLYFDLDTVITGDLREIAAYGGPFACLRDFYRQWGLGSGVMAWEAGAASDIWDEWNEAGRPMLQGGDQIMVEVARPGAVRLQDYFPGQIASYKAHCLGGVPEGVRVVCFHGTPRPHEVMSGWVPELWR